MDEYVEWLTALLIKYGTYKGLSIMMDSHFKHARRYEHIEYISNYNNEDKNLGYVITDAAVKYLKRKQREHTV